MSGIGNAAVYAQQGDPGRIYKSGGRVGDARVSAPVQIHKEEPKVNLGASGISAVGMMFAIVIDVDGTVREVSVTETKVWVRDGNGSTLIEDSDPRWKKAVIDKWERDAIKAIRHSRFRPAMLNGVPVPVRRMYEVKASEL